jgi:tetratricopeptide (TPR) repeat protein
MGGSKNIQTDNTEQQLEPSVSPGSFFKKYTVLTPDEHVASDEPIFKKYAPPRRDGSEEATDKPSADVFDMPVTGSTAAVAKWSNSRVPIYIWGGAAAVLILAGWMILSLLLHKEETSTQRTNSNSRPAAEETSSAAGANGLPNESPTSGSLASILTNSSNESQKDRSRLAQASRAISSPGFEHNTMLARAREFEDRGMLSRAEEEYRAVAASFPGDRFSQVGLSRVQSALTAERVNEMSRVSRETGLRNFRMADYAGAERELSAAVDGGRTDTATLYALGMSHLKLGNHVKATLSLDHCIAVSPNYAPALVGLAQANAATGRRDQALSLLQRALELGGGAEFTPAKIRDMIASLDPKRAVPNPPVSSVPSVERSKPAFFAPAVHAHDLLLASCKGDLQIVNSVVHFNASTPSHSFHVLASQVSDARVTGNMLRLRVNGRSYRFALNERTARDFLNALIAE